MKWRKEYDEENKVIEVIEVITSMTISTIHAFNFTDFIEVDAMCFYDYLKTKLDIRLNNS